MTGPEVEVRYSTSEVCDLVGCTYRQLDYWVRRELLAPRWPASGSGIRRRWSERDVREARALTRLMAMLNVTGVETLWPDLLVMHRADQLPAAFIRLAPWLQVCPATLFEEES